MFTDYNILLNVIIHDDATLTEPYKASKEVARRLWIACGNFEVCYLLEEMFSVKYRNTNIGSLCSSNRMVFVTGTGHVAFAVQNNYLNVQTHFSVSPWDVCGRQNSTSTGFFQSPSVYLSISFDQWSTFIFISIKLCYKDKRAIRGKLQNNALSEMISSDQKKLSYTDQSSQLLCDTYGFIHL